MSHLSNQEVIRLADGSLRFGALMPAEQIRRMEAVVEAAMEVLQAGFGRENAHMMVDRAKWLALERAVSALAAPTESIT